jgi:hypothetical protein
VTHGADMTFTTKPSVTLSSSTLTVKNGSTSLGVKCVSRPNCKGKLSLAASVKVGKKHQNITFGSTSFSIKNGKKSTLKFKLSGKGLTTLRKAHHQRLKVTLLIKFSSHQPTLSKTVTLAL